MKNKTSGILLFLLIILFMASILIGTVSVNLKNLTETEKYIMFNMRLPRALGAILAGAVLASSGLVFQSVFKNPMADSYVLGISSTSSFAVCLGMLFFNTFNSPYALSLYSIAGSILCTVLLFKNYKNYTFQLLLTGIAINFFFSAATTLLIYLNKQQINTILFWTLGSLSSMTWEKILIIAVVMILSFSIEYKEKYSLDLLLLDNGTARSAGLDTDLATKKLLLTSSISTAVVVAFCGVIGFVGIISSHIIRILLGPTHKKIFIPTALCGSILLLLADIISRTIIRPTELPIGVITSIIGAPVLVSMIRRKNYE